MKSVPVLRVVLWSAVFAGGAGAGYFLRGEKEGAHDGSGGEKPAAGAAKAAVASAERKPQMPGLLQEEFDGTVAGLLRIAKRAGEYNRARVQIYLALLPLTAEQIKSLTESYAWPANPNRDEMTVRSALVDLWTEKDAEGALRWAGGLRQPSGRYMRHLILIQLGTMDMEKALALARKLPAGQDRDGALYELSYHLAATNPQRALDMALSAGMQGANQAYNVLRRWAESDPEAALAKAKSLTWVMGRDNAVEGVLSVWSTSDPQSARNAALALPEGKRRVNALYSVLANWAQSDPAAAHAAALQLGAGKERDSALKAVINAWALTDPAAAVQAVMALPKKNVNRQSMLGEVYSGWTKIDPAAATASLASMQFPFKYQRDSLMSTAADSWAQNDPQAAMKWAQSLPAKEGGTTAVFQVLAHYARSDGAGAAALWQSLPPEQKRGNLNNLIQGWALQDADGALRFARTLEKPQDRMTALLSVTQTLDLDKPERIKAVLNELPAGPMRVEGMQSVFSRQLQSDGTAAVRWLRSLPEAERTAVLNSSQYYGLNSGERGADPEEMKLLLTETPGLSDNEGLWSSTADGLAGRDPVAALAWASGLESPGVRTQAQQAVLQNWTFDDPQAALQAALSIPDSDTRKDVLPGIFRSWAGDDPDALLAWAETATGSEREAALLQGSLAKANNEPVASAAVVDSLLAAKGGEKPGASLNGAVSQVASSWFRQDIGEAVGWAMRLPAGDAQEAAVSSIAGSWARLDAVAASQWVQGMPAGGTRDVAAQRLSQEIQSSDPERAFAWAASIANAAKREESVRQVAQNWMGSDRTAARAAIEAAPVSENVRASLLEQLSKRE